MSAQGDHLAALTIDLEDYYHPELIRRHARPVPSEPRVEAATAPILDLLDRHEVRATFFVVGDVLRTAPRLVERIHEGGHEIGCHSFSHRPLWELDPDSFREELRRFRVALHEIIPEASLRGFRAPTFSVDRRTGWMFGVLAEEGFAYDSSIVPARGPLYGCPGAPLGIYRPARHDFLQADPSGPVVEFPAPVARIGGSRLPIGGGFYLRTIPFWAYRTLIRRALRRRPFFLYIHPWETDSGTPRLPLPRLARWATYGGIEGALGKVERLLQMVRFTTMQGVLQASGFGG